MASTISRKTGDSAATGLATARQSRLFVDAMERGLQVLGAFSERRPAMKLADLALAANVSKSAAQRFAFTLVALGYLRKDPVTGEFALAVRSLELGLRYLQTSRLVTGTNPYLHALNRACKETCSLAEPDGLDMVYVSRFPAHKEMFINMPLGMRIPMYCTASGRALLSRMAPARAVDILKRSHRVAYTANTITALARLQELLDEAQVNGFAWADSEYYSGDVNISAPILDATGAPIASVNVSAAASRFTLAEAKLELGPLVVETARGIGGSAAMRYFEHGSGGT